MKIWIQGGNLYDPGNNIHGEVRDLCIEDGVIVEACGSPEVIIDARGQAVLPGGIDVHSHVGFYGLASLRLRGLYPGAGVIGRRYAEMGFTHVHEPLMTITTAAAVHHELAAIPVVDASASLVLPLRDLGGLVREGDFRGGVMAIAALMRATKAMGVKLFEPELQYPQEVYAHLNIDAETVVDFFQQVAARCSMRLALHACEKVLTIPGLEPRSLWLANLGGALSGTGAVEAAAALLAAGACGDMGLAPPGRRVELALGPGGQGQELLRIDLGFSQPLKVRLTDVDPKVQQRQILGLSSGPARERIAFSLGCVAPSAPRSFSRLFEALLHGGGKGGYSLGEMVAATRTLPAAILGLRDKGHLGPGARADVAIYEVSEAMTAEEMAEGLRRCRVLVRNGRVVIRDYRWTGQAVQKSTYWREIKAGEEGDLGAILPWTTQRPESLDIRAPLAANLFKVTD